MDLLGRAARRWYVKLAVQNSIALLPPGPSFALNEKLTGLFKGDADDRLDLEGRVQLSLHALRLIAARTGFDFEDKVVLELGTGWHGVDLVLFHLLGVRRIHTIDHNEHLKLTTLQSKIRLFEELDIVDVVAGDLASPEKVRERWEALAAGAPDCESLDDLLRLMNVDYRIAESCSPRSLPIEPDSIDLFYSSSVLQRIPEEDLVEDMRYVGSVLLRSTGVVFHLTDQRDINTLNDDRLWHLNYLRYSDFVFKTFLSSRLNSQNRLRESDFIEMMERSDMVVTFVRSFRRAEDEERVKHLPLGKRFRTKSPEDLAIVHSLIVGTHRDHPDSSPVPPVVERDDRVG